MKPHQGKLKTAIITALGCLAGALTASAQSADALINKLVEKGILSEKEAKELVAESAPTNAPSGSKWKINDAIKNIQLFGDVRFRYEYRGAENAPGSGSTQNDYYKERFRYAIRLGLKGDLYDNFYYGLRLETSTNPRSPWVTFGDDSNPTPFAKNSDGVGIGQVYLGWRPTDWYEMTLGRMPMPLYVTPMLWDADLNPEGAFEKLKFSAGNVDLFANFGQFVYQDTSPDAAVPSSDTFLLAWQVGANAHLAKDVSFKVAPVLYNYTGHGTANGLNHAFSGQGLGGINVNTNGYNQNGINDLLIVETPAELNFNLGQHQARLFGDFAYNIQGDDRARAAFATTPAAGGLTHAFTGENIAYQVGLAYGNLGMVYGLTSKKHTWEARVYWQHVEQYAADVNLLDSDFFEGRANLEGLYSALSYGFTDNIIATVRYGYAHRINNSLGTGGNNLDMPILNPIKNYNLLQLDLTWRF